MRTFRFLRLYTSVNLLICPSLHSTPFVVEAKTFYVLSGILTVKVLLGLFQVVVLSGKMLHTCNDFDLTETFMKKLLIVLVVLVLMPAAAGMAQSPFEVNNTGSQAQKKIVAADEPQSQNPTGEQKELRGFFKILKGVLDVLKAVVEGIIPSANAAEVDEMPVGKMAATNGTIASGTRLAFSDVKSAEIGKQTAGLQNSGTVGSSTQAATGSKAPAAVSPDPAKGKAVTTGSAKFKEWFKTACNAHCDQWEFPDVTNKYGEKITREDYMRAIIWIESRGVHMNGRGTLTKSWAGAQGFMQLMPNTARGLKIDAKDGAQNLKGGAKYLTEIFNSGAVSKKSGAEKLIMAACAYNLGPFSKSMKQSWNELKSNRKVPTETRGYGLKLKMCLGLELTEDERKLVKEWLVTPGYTVDTLIEENYTNTKGIGR